MLAWGVLSKYLQGRFSALTKGGGLIVSSYLLCIQLFYSQSKSHTRVLPHNARVAHATVKVAHIVKNLVCCMWLAHGLHATCSMQSFLDDDVNELGLVHVSKQV